MHAGTLVRYLVLSDIHANLEALEAVGAAAARRPFDAVLCLGDLVGYGASPNEVTEQIRGLRPAVIIRGNHDKAAAGIIDTSDFNPIAGLAVAWTQRQLTVENAAYLAGLPAGPRVVDDLIEICHGAPHDEDAYLVSEADARVAAAAASRPVCLFGHTHVSLMLKLTADRFELARPAGGASGSWRVALDPRSRYLINPGSVGQPRDGDPRAAFAIVDTGERVIEFFREPYDVTRASRTILDAGLPSLLADRLLAGR